MGARSGHLAYARATLPTAHLGKLLLGRLSTPINVVGQILQMDALGAFLTFFYSHERQGDVARTELAQKFGERQVRKEVTTDLLERNDGLAIVLCHQQKGGVE